MNNSQILKLYGYHLFDFNSIEEICLIDDDPAFIFLNQMIFKITHPQISIQSFNCIKDAFIHFQSEVQIKRLVLLDIDLGLTTGFELLDMLSSLAIKNMDVVMHSSCSEDEYIRKAFTYSLVKAFIVKPLSVEIAELISGKTTSIENQPNFESMVFTRERLSSAQIS